MKPLLGRGLGLVAAIVAALGPASAQAPQPSTAAQRIEIRAQAIEAFDPREPARSRFGALSFRGGLVLESSQPNFGGLSGLHVTPDGRFLSLTDKGYWLRGRIVTREERPIAIADAEMAPIRGPDGRPLKGRGWFDTEALAVDGGKAYVAIERVNEILRFDYATNGLRARGHPVAAPPAMKSLPYNRSLECLAIGPRGSPLAGTLIAVSERGLDAQGNLISFLIGPVSGTFALRRSDEFDVSDCTVTPRNELLVLERRFSWARGVAMRIRSIPLDKIKPGALLDGREVIFADMGFQIDNMEGLAVHREASGALVLTLVSDDNFSPLQRTLLLQFTLAGE